MQRAETILTYGNTLWLAGLTFYTYRSMVAFRAELNKQAAAFNVIIEDFKKIQRATSEVPSIMNAIRTLDADIGNLSASTVNNNELDAMISQMELIIKTMNDGGMKVENIMPYRGYGNHTYHPPSSSCYQRGPRDMNTRGKPNRQPVMGKRYEGNNRRLSFDDYQDREKDDDRIGSRGNRDDGDDDYDFDPADAVAAVRSERSTRTRYG